jgi:hypothetical protein
LNVFETASQFHSCAAQRSAVTWMLVIGFQGKKIHKNSHALDLRYWISTDAGHPGLLTAAIPHCRSDTAPPQRLQ